MRTTSATPASNSKSLWSKCAGRADSGEDGLECSGGAVHVESDFDHSLDYALYLLFGGLFLHCNNHGSFPVLRGSCARCHSPLPDVVDLPLEASSCLWSARITSMMRS